MGRVIRPRPPKVEYTPDLDGDADPGEVVWTWVPYEDDPAQGKDRPVLVVGRDAEGLGLVAVALSSKDQSHRDDAMFLGTGAWDSDFRPSWVKLDRLIPITADVRREGAVLDRRRFDDVVARLAELHGWSPSLPT